VANSKLFNDSGTVSVLYSGEWDMEIITNCVQVNMWTKAITDYLCILERMKEITKLPCQDSNQFFS